MNTTGAILLAALALAGCAMPPRRPPPEPPLSAEQDRTSYNNEQVTLFVGQDAGWQAWLGAMQRSDQANSMIGDVSHYNMPMMAIIETITAAQDAYRAAERFRLPPFTVTSSCLNLPSETDGSVRLRDGLIVRYATLLSETRNFANGASCVMSVGYIDAVYSSGGLTLAAAEPGQTIDWQRNFARYLVWSEPFRTLSTGATLSQSDLVALIEK